MNALPAPSAMRRTTSIALLLAGTAIAAAPASAQEAAAADQAMPGDIIVTATKRSESLQKVPISIQALSTETLEQRQVSSFDDYAKMLPSVSFQSFGPGQAQLSFRGITSGGDGLHGGSLPTASLYLDEIPVTTIAGSVDLHIYDVERVEALSGPQGTLFGASSLAGTLRIITNKPNPDKFEAGWDMELNKFGKGDAGGSLEGFANIPISENAAIRLVGYYQRDGGYIDNVPGSRTYLLGDVDPTTNVTINNDDLVEKNFNDVETYGGRAALRIDLDDNWTVTPAASYQHQESKGPFLFDPRKGDLNVTDFIPTSNKDRWWLASLTIEGKVGDWDLTYAGGYFRRKVNNQQDYSYYTVAYDAFEGSYYTYFQNADGSFLDPTQRQILGDVYTKMNHELRVSSPSENRLRITTGLFYQRQTNTIEADYIVPGLGGIPNSPIVPGSVDSIFLTRAKRIDRDYAMFGEVAFDITEGLTLNAGIRGFIFDNSNGGFSGFASNAADTALCLPTTETDRPCNNYNKQVNGSGETHKVNLTWQIDPQRMIYATWSTGYRPGGTNRRPGILAYDSDTLTNYEIGWKTSWFDRALRFNAAAFIEKWKQLQFGLSPVGSAGVTNIYNAGDAKVKGVEGDITLALGGLTLSGSGTYIDAKLTTDFCQFDEVGNSICTPGVAPAASRGTRLPVQPKFKGTATARYEFPIGSTDAFVQGSMMHQGGTRSFLTAADYAVVGPTKGFTTFDFSLGGKISNWSVEVFIQNAFDKRGILSLNASCAVTICGAYSRAYPIRPQLFGIKVGQRF